MLKSKPVNRVLDDPAAVLWTARFLKLEGIHWLLSDNNDKMFLSLYGSINSRGCIHKHAFEWSIGSQFDPIERRQRKCGLKRPVKFHVWRLNSPTTFQNNYTVQRTAEQCTLIINTTRQPAHAATYCSQSCFRVNAGLQQLQYCNESALHAQIQFSSRTP